jgi:hypothetical protein
VKKVLTIIVLLLFVITSTARNTDRVKFPGGKCYMLRVQLCDKQGTTFSLDHPEDFLSQRAIERRQRQRLAIDSTDLPLCARYVQAVEATGVETVAVSKWNNTMLVRVRKLDVMKTLLRLPFVTHVTKVWTSPDSIERRKPRPHYRTTFNKWDHLDENPEGVTYDQIEMLGGNRLHKQG